MTEDEVTAFHEAAHAVFAVSGRWTRLAGPVAIDRDGSGDVVMSTSADAIRKSLLFDRDFDREQPRIELIGALLAGPIAELMLAERGRIASSERDLSNASWVDRKVIAEQLGQIVPPRPGLMDRLEREVRQRLEQPATWAAIERFAEVLLERRRLEAEEATAVLEAIAPAACQNEGTRADWGLRAAVIAAALMIAGAATVAISRMVG